MKFLQKTVIFFVTFSSCFSIIFPVTSAEMALAKAYRQIGFNRKEAKNFCGNINLLCKQQLHVDLLKHSGVSSQAIAMIMEEGMLIALSKQGLANIEKSAKNFAGFAHENKRFPLSRADASILQRDTKKFIFSWIAKCLNKYRVSLYLAYVNQYDCLNASLDLSDGSSDFMAHVVTLEEVIEELRRLGLTAP